MKNLELLYNDPDDQGEDENEEVEVQTEEATNPPPDKDRPDKP